ncbi:helix-turn-helix domain-containing protein [Eggerthella sinensis]|uniref:helix-turn-helix domain-containing protein n=1 Tax=Eggerthella sinensis TaxID=242230 RepID=UPI003A4D562A
MTVKIVLKDTLKRRGISSKDFSAKIGITPITLSHILTGKCRCLNISLLDSICKELNCAVDDVLTFTDTEH